MNREIKFRAWNKEARIMIHAFWVGSINSKAYSIGSRNELIQKDFEIMQYTGLKDKNGKEICEGDYLRQEGLFVKVTWSEFDAGFVFADEIGSCMSVTNGNSHNWEIDGNIYES